MPNRGLYSERAFSGEVCTKAATLSLTTSGHLRSGLGQAQRLLPTYAWTRLVSPGGYSRPTKNDHAQVDRSLRSGGDATVTVAFSRAQKRQSHRPSFPWDLLAMSVLTGLAR